MSTTNTLLFEPDYAIHPGETLAETLEELGMSQAELAQRMGRPLQMISEIIQGKKAITALGRDVAEAQARAYIAVDRIDWQGGFCRRDIGWRAVATKVSG